MAQVNMPNTVIRSIASISAIAISLSIMAFASQAVVFKEPVTGLLGNNKEAPIHSHELPALGSGNDGIFSREQEYRLGRAWLKQLRSQVKLLHDPIAQEYTENLLYRLASHSSLINPQLEVVLVNQSTINAFAVPGGVIGVNGGLFLYAKTEDELSSVLAHELAHLSQHHFARRFEQSKRANALTLGALLAGIIIAASGGGEAGLAAIASSQAAAIQSQLSYSRAHEREADRLGIQIMAESGLDPYAMPEFFTTMLNKTQMNSDRIPEFVLTHPLTDTRVSDSRARASQYTRPLSHSQIDFYLISQRMRALFAANPLHHAGTLSQQIKSASGEQLIALHYGQAQAYYKANQYEKALKALQQAQSLDRPRIIYDISRADILLAQEKREEALAILKRAIAVNPMNYSLSLSYSAALAHKGSERDKQKAAALLHNLSLERPEDPLVWQRLTKLQGALGDIVAVHRAQAEYLYLHNSIDPAIEQLKFAAQKSRDNPLLKAKIKHRAKEMRSHQDDLKI